MLTTNVYLNSLYMMSHRGFSQADDLISDLSKEPRTKYIVDDKYANIGFNFDNYMRSDFKDFEGMYSMSYLMTDESRARKEFVIFGTGNKAFLTIVSEIMLGVVNDSYDYGFNLILVKGFKADCLQKINRISTKINVFVFSDTQFEKPPFHAYGPRMSLMEDSEVDLLLKELKITKAQMKKISKDDPLVKYFGYTKGAVIRIHRTPMITGSLVTNTLDYRLVVG